MSLPDELLNVPLELNTFIDRMVNIFVILAESLRASFLIGILIGHGPCKR